MMLLESEKLRKVLLYVGILAILFQACYAVCPPDWEENNGRCYYFSTGKVASLPWHEAQSQCERMGANLVVINDPTEDSIIFARRGQAANTYIGLHDLDEYDQWQWVDGTPLTYANWASGQPDHWENAPGGIENCVAIPSSGGGPWNDQACSIPSAYVCERSNDAATIDRCDTANGWQELSTGKCYKFVDAAVTWPVANDACKAMGAELTAITSDTEQKSLSVEVNSKNQFTWIGLSNVNHQQGEYYWSNEVDIFSGSSYNNWGDNEPASTSYSSCVGMSPDAENYSPWTTQRCGEEHSYICETGLTGSCAPGWRLSQGTCYYYVLSQNAWGTWVDARDYCKAMGANILVLETEKEQQYISQQLPEILDAGANEFWLGISDSANDGVWVWEDENKTPVSDGEYTNWNKNQPLNRADAWDCVQIYTGFYLGRWETGDCFQQLPYICEIPPGVDPKPLVPVANTHKGCDPGWLWFDSHCYYFVHEEVTWNVAEGKCRDMGGNLASILSGEEDSFIVDHVSASSWIGGHAITDIYTFEWSDNSAWVFSNWAGGEPNNDAQGCAQLWLEAGYQWDDAGCEVPMNYVCKKPEQDCWEPLGMEDRTILDSQITASSMWDQNHAPYLGRLNNDKDGGTIGAWAPQGDDRTQAVLYFQVHLVPARTVSGITTQGRPRDFNQFVTSYKVAYSNDGATWAIVKDGGADKIFTANADTNSLVTNKLPVVIVTSYIRIYPWTWNDGPTMRAEILGCTNEGNELPTITPNTDCTSVSYQNRLECGYSGVTASECRSRGCCWDNSVPDTIWCFYKKGDFDSRCGKDWIYDPGGQLYCYHFNPYKIRDRSDAELYCFNMGGNLLSINSMHEQYYVTAHVTGLVSASALWIGANRMDDDKGWLWSDGNPFNYKYWRGGEPNDWTGTEFCVEMYTSDGTWNDNPCYYQRGIACKKGVNDLNIETDDGNIVRDICEGESGTLICGGNQVILIHHASYGRTSPLTCGEGNAVPVGGCHSDDSLRIVSQICNGQSTCQLEALNEVYGDPCHGTYKYLNVIYSCETATCLEQLGVENGTITDGMISESSSIDGSHTGENGRLNSGTSWATNEGEGAWMQVLLSKHMRISGIMIQGAADENRWVKTFKVAYAKDETNSAWADYKDYDNNVAIFEGTSDRNTIKQVIFAERVFSTGLRIYPLTWNGERIGMRMDVTGCNPFQQVGCDTLGDVLFAADTDAVGTVKTVDCPAYCPELLGYQYDVYGDGIYSGNSQICPAAIHAGVLLDPLGGAVAMKLEPGQSSYEGTERHGMRSKDLDRFTPIAFSFTSPERNCESGWIPYDQYCFLPVVDAVPWQSAEAACMVMDSHLVSMYSSIDNDFVFQLMVLNEMDSAWTGLSSLISANEYTWTDSTLVRYTNWGYKQPDRSVKSCVYLRYDTATWDDHLCEDPRPFVCKKFKGYYQHDDGSTVAPPEGCKEGWIPYEDKCYFFQRDAVRYEECTALCAEQGGVPVDILNKFTQSFLHTVIGQEDFRWWLGIRGTPEVGGSSWAWESGYPLTYDNWGRGSPDVTKGECAVFYGGQIGAGMWYSHRCENPAYSMCQMTREGYVPPPKTTLPPSGGCPGGWVTLEESGWCYRAYLVSREDILNKVSWNNAYHQCLATGGDLVSIHDSAEEKHILDLLKTQVGGESSGLWIGLNNRASAAQGAENGWEWSDSSAVSYTTWGPGYPDSTRENNCVELRYEGDVGTGRWRNIDCDQTREFICKLKKGIDAISPTVPPTGKPNQQCGSADDGVWLEFGGWCYLFNAVGTDSWHTAEDKCFSVGGHLLSVHSNSEQSFITNQIAQMNGSTFFWTGLREIGGVDGEFQWSDGTAVDYVNWIAGEPNDYNGMEQCVFIREPTGKWNDGNCGLDHSGFICKKRIGDPPILPEPTDPWPGGCPSGWLAYDNYCYQVHGEYTACATDADDWSDGQCRAGWYNARTMCRDLDGDLVTIHNKYENAFVTAQILRLPINAWTGLSDETWYNKYIWSTGEEVTYTNWNAGEPNHWNGEERCAEMIHREDLAGRWNDNRCEIEISYVCQKKKDASLSAGQEINNNNKCPKGWMQYDTVNDNYICYYLDTTERTFEEAKSNCRNMKSGASLVSYQTMFEQHFVTSYIRDATAWIGLQFDTDQSRWMWVDNWPVWITNWGEHEPGSDTTKLCAMSKDSYLGSEWVTGDCNDKRPSVCRWTTESVPPTPGHIEGSCPESDWQVHGGFCYREYTTQGDEARMFTWSEAEAKCQEHFGHLVSIGSRSQTEWINSWSNTSESLWIGLRDNGQGGWSWTDNRPVAYINWNSGEPNNWGENGEDCVEIYPDGKWNDVACDKKQGYMCTVPKVIATDENGNVIHYQTPAPKPVGGGSNAGVIVGAVLGSIAALVLIGAIGYYLYKNDKFQFKTMSNPPAGGFDNPQFHASGSKGFDDIAGTTDA